MFDYVRNNQKLIQLVLAVIMLPFALWGIGSYVHSGGGDTVATVGGTPIAPVEFEQALREQQDRLRPQLGEAGQDILNSPTLRRNVLEELINQRLLVLYAAKANLRVSDAMLAGFITSVPSLQENGKFSRARYEALVASQGMSVETFEARVRQDLLTQQAMMAAGDAAVAGILPSERWLAAQLEDRQISLAEVRADQFAATSKPDAAAIKKYYDANQSRFETPEQVKVEYLVLSQSKLVENAKIDEAAITALYQANESHYKQPEQRQASHILFRVDKGAPEAEVKAAQAKAEQVLAQLKAHPADFAKLAKQYSQDPGSAQNGGDLGYFGRGMMVKPFEDAAFALKEGQMSDLVRSDFGFHIIKLTGIHPERVRPLAEVRAEIVAELKRQTGAKRFAEAAEGFANTVYEQPDSLKPAADKYALTVQTTDWLSKGGQVEAPFTSPKLMQAVFSPDAVEGKRNTEAIDVGNNTLVAARVVDHRPATVEPLEKVSGAIAQVLALETAASKAAAQGQATLEKLKSGAQVTLAWNGTRTVSRLNAPDLSPAARDAIFAADTGKLPTYVGVKTPGGYTLYRIDKITPFDPKSPEAAPRAQALRQRYAQVTAQEDLVGWLAALRQRYPVTINNAILEKQK